MADRRRRCKAMVWKRDTLRYWGGKQHFKMHYTKAQCARAAADDGKFCGQHQAIHNRGQYVSLSEYHEFIDD